MDTLTLLTLVKTLEAEDKEKLLFMLLNGMLMEDYMLDILLPIINNSIKSLKEHEDLTNKDGTLKLKGFEVLLKAHMQQLSKVVAFTLSEQLREAGYSQKHSAWFAGTYIHDHIIPSLPSAKELLKGGDVDEFLNEAYSDMLKAIQKKDNLTE